jgi:predicted glycosyltransferase
LRKQRLMDLLKTTVAPAIRRVDHILLPHSEEEWPRSALPPPLRSKAVHLGGVVRGLNVDAVPSVRARYASPDQRLAVVTIGGGGYTEAHALLDVAFQAAQACKVEGLKWVLVYGPYYPFDIPSDSLARVARIRYEANMPELLASADVVVCNAGYNTISELDVCGTPSVVVPRTTRGRDDQVARALAFAKTGRAAICDEEANAIAANVEGVLLRQTVARTDVRSDTHGADYRYRLGTKVLLALRS